MAQRITPERLALFEACLDDGWSFHQIQTTHNAAWETLNRHFPGREWSVVDGAKLGAAARRAYRQVVSSR